MVMNKMVIDPNDDIYAVKMADGPDFVSYWGVGPESGDAVVLRVTGDLVAPSFGRNHVKIDAYLDPVSASVQTAVSGVTMTPAWVEVCRVYIDQGVEDALVKAYLMVTHEFTLEEEELDVQDL